MRARDKASLEKKLKFEKMINSFGFVTPGDREEGRYYLKNKPHGDPSKDNIISVGVITIKGSVRNNNLFGLLLSKVTKEAAIIPGGWFEKQMALVNNQPATGAVFLEDIDGLTPLIKTKDKILSNNMDPEILTLQPVYKAIWTGLQWEFDEDFHIGVD